MKKVSLIVLLSACSGVYAEPVVVDHSSYPASAAPVATVNTPSTNTMYELMGRIEQLQAEVQQLTGKVDEQAYRIDELKKHQSTMYSDFDERLQAIENKGTASGTANPAADASVPATPSDPAATPSAVVANDSVAEAKPAVANPALSGNVASTPKSDPASQVSGGEKKEYYDAYNELRAGHTKQSITLFNTYLTQYPRGVLANNAQYWLGEAYLVDQDNNSASKAFSGVVDNYPDGAKVPDALLRLGMIEQGQKNLVKAREYFTRVLTSYPKSTAAQSAQKKLAKLDEVKN